MLVVGNVGQRVLLKKLPVLTVVEIHLQAVVFGILYHCKHSCFRRSCAWQNVAAVKQQRIQKCRLACLNLTDNAYVKLAVAPVKIIYLRVEAVKQPFKPGEVDLLAAGAERFYRLPEPAPEIIYPPLLVGGFLEYWHILFS